MNEKYKNLLTVFIVVFALTVMLLMLTSAPLKGGTGYAAKETQSKDCTSYCDKNFKEFEGWVDCHKKCMEGETS